MRRSLKLIFAVLIAVGILFATYGLLFAFDINWLADDEGRLLLIAETAILLFMSEALSLGLRCSGFDFSLGAVAVLSPTLALCLPIGKSSTALVLLSLFFGCLLGLISGGVQVLTALPSAFCSLVICLIYEGISQIQWSVAGVQGASIPTASVALYIVSIFLLLCGRAVILNKTAFGYNLRAISKNPEICRYAGVNFKISALISHIVSGGVMGCAGAMLCMRQGELILSGLNFSSVRILFFGLLPLFAGRLFSRISGDGRGAVLGAVCSAVVYSVLSELGAVEDEIILICGGMLLILLIYISNEKKIFRRIRIRNIPKEKN